MPRLIEGLRLALGTGWIFLIVGEGIASDKGMGFRIFMARRYMGMDTIIPYVLIITAIAFLTDITLKQINKHQFKWYNK